MLMQRIHRYIAGEVLAPTLLGVFVFTLVVLMGRILRLAELVLNKGVSVSEIAILFACMMPQFLVLTLPLAFMMGILLAFGRFSADAEIIALKASGVSLLQMLKPALWLAIVISLITAALSLSVVPASNTAFRSKIFELLTKHATAGIRPQVFNADFDGLVLYAADVDETSGDLSGVFISEQRFGSTPSVISARRGRLLSDPDNLTLSLHLEDGALHRKVHEKDDEIYRVVKFGSHDIQLDDMNDQLSTGTSRRRKDSEYAFSELYTIWQSEADSKRRNQLAVEMLHRATLPTTPLIFALVGLPLGIQTTRSGRGGGFALGLLVFLVYYVLHSLSKTLAVDAGITPLVVLAPPTVFFVAGILMFRHALRERRFQLLDRLQDALHNLFSRRQRKER